MNATLAIRRWMLALMGTGLMATAVWADAPASLLQEASQNVQMDPNIVPCSLVQQGSILDPSSPSNATSAPQPPGPCEPACGCADACGCGGSGGCGNGCCGYNFGNGCCDPTWVVATEITMLHARFLGGTNSTITSPNGTLLGSSTNINGGSFQRMAFAPRITFGRQGLQWGVMGRFWYLSDNSQTNSPFGTGPVGIFGNDSLKAYTFDLEVTRQWLFANNAKIVASLGGRYASFAADGTQSVQSTGPVGLSTYENFGVTSVRFNGTGVTSSVWVRRPIFSSGLSVYGGARGSVLFGTNNAIASTGSSATGLALGVSTLNSGAASVNNTLAIGEIQLGLQYDHQLVAVPASFFFRVGLEAQNWNNGSSAAIATSTSHTFFGLRPSTSSATAGQIDLTLYGLALATGVNW